MSLIARKSSFLDKIKNDKVLVFDNLFLENGKTSTFKQILVSSNLDSKKITLLVSSIDENLNRAISNLSNVYAVNVSCVSIYEMLDCEWLVMDKEGFNNLTQILMR